MIELPIDSFLPQLKSALGQNNALILKAEPGAGKTSRLPPTLLAQTTKKILVLEPRRMAAVGAAYRVAEEQNLSLGDQVGYHVRLDSKFKNSTRLIFLTEALLIKRLQRDPELSDVECVILDEFHERSIHTDLSLVLLKELQELSRPDLKIVVMSATLDTQKLSEYLPQAKVFEIPGKTFPLEVVYQKQSQILNTNWQFIEQVQQQVRNSLKSSATSGDVLVFLPGLSEIERTAEKLLDLGLPVLKLHGSLPLEQQREVLKKSDQRRVILSTNVAESSVTIDGVDTVIDSGLARKMVFDTKLGTSELLVARISLANGAQRAGRAARQKNGVCYRLWNNFDETSMPAFEIPQILQAPLEETLLTLASMGIRQYQNLSWFEAPPEKNLRAATEELQSLGALSKDNELTPLGRDLADLPLPPRLGKLFLTAKKYGYAAAGAVMASLLAERDLFDQAFTSSHAESDLLDRLEALASNPRGAKFERLLKVARELEAFQDIKIPSREKLDEILWDVFQDHLCRRREPNSPTALWISGRGTKLHQNSKVTKSGFFLALQMAAINAPDPVIFLAHGLPTAFVKTKLKDKAALKSTFSFDKETGILWVYEGLAFQGLFLEEPRKRKASNEEAKPHFEEILKSEGIEFLFRNSNFQNWWGRLKTFEKIKASQLLSDAEIEIAVSEVAYSMSSVPDLAEMDLVYFFGQKLDAKIKTEFEKSLPSHLTTPNGKTFALEYSDEGAKIELKLQHAFGWLETPKIAGGAIPLTVVLLAPNQRPTAITKDLKSFWQNGYKDVRKDLRARYPKHAWPEDPTKIFKE